jgi:hypothetical protein
VSLSGKNQHCVITESNRKIHFVLGTGAAMLAFMILAFWGAGCRSQPVQVKSQTQVQADVVSVFPVAPDDEWNNFLRSADEFEKRGEYDSAQKIYWKIINEDTRQADHLKAMAGLQRTEQAAAALSQALITQLVAPEEAFELSNTLKNTATSSGRLPGTNARIQTDLLAHANLAAGTNGDFAEDSAKRQLGLAKMFETNDDFVDAQTFYLKALDVTRDKSTETNAWTGLVRVREASDSFWQKTKEGWTACVLGLVVALPLICVTILIAILTAAWKFIGRNKGRLKIDFTSSNDQFLGADFEGILTEMATKAREYYSSEGVFGSIDPGTDTPATLMEMVRPRNDDLEKIVETIAPEVAKWLILASRLFDKPEFGLQVSYRDMGCHVNVIAALEKRPGKVLRKWDQNVRKAGLFNFERDLAYLVIMLIKKEMNL